MSTLILSDVEPYVPAPIPPVAKSNVIVSFAAWLRVKAPPPSKMSPAANVIVASLAVGKSLLNIL